MGFRTVGPVIRETNMDVKPIKLPPAQDVAAIVHTRQGLKEILHHAPDAIVCICRSGKITEFNARAEQIFNCNRADALGKGFLDLCIEHSDRFNLYAQLRRVQAGEAVNRVKSTLKADGDGTRTLEWSFSSVQSDGEEAALIVATARDVSDGSHRQQTGQAGTRLAFNPDFDETVDLVLSSLSAIIERIEKVNEKSTPRMLVRLRQYYEQAETPGRGLSEQKTEAIERLILSLINPPEE